FIEGPARGFRDGIPGDETAKKARAAFAGFNRSFGVGAAVRRWNINKPGERVVAHKPPVVNGPLTATTLGSRNKNQLGHLQIVSGGPYSFHQQLGREQLSGFCIED